MAAFANRQEMNAGLVRRREPEEVQKQEKRDEPLLKNQKILLTWLVDEPRLYPRIKQYISPDDFAQGIHRKAAKKLFEALEAGQTPSPSAIMTTLQADEEASEEEQKEIASLFCTKISDHIRRVMGINEVELEDETSEFATKEEKEKALHDILVSIKRASLQTCMETGGSDKNAFTRILEAKKALQELQKTHISLD